MSKSNIAPLAAQPFVSIRVLSLHSLLIRSSWRVTSPRARPSHLFMWVTRGQGRVRINGIQRGFGPNSLIFIPAGAVYSFHVAGAAQGFALYLPERLKIATPNHPVQIKAQSIFEQGQITGYFDQLNREYLNTDFASQRVLESYVVLLGVWLDRTQARNEFRAAIGNRGAAAQLLERFCLLLERDFRTNASVAGFATQLSVTSTHLTRVCRQLCDQSALDMIQQRLVLEAQLLLDDTDMKITDISQRLGFGSAAYFSRLFAKLAGNSPREFRRQLRGAAPSSATKLRQTLR